AAEVERAVHEILTPWEERFAEAATTTHARELAHAFPPAYVETQPVARALADVALVRRLSAERPFAVAAVHPDDPEGGDPEATLLRIAQRTPVALGQLIPTLANLALEVLDEAHFEIALPPAA